MKSVFERLRPLAWLAGHPVARRRPVRTWSRWAYWQCRQRLTNRPKVIDFVGGTRLEVAPHGALTGCWYVTLPDYEEMTFLLRLLRRDDIFFDVGANAGVFSTLAASRRCTVTAFEPIPDAYAQLSRNAELNRGFGVIRTEQLAVSSSVGRLRITTEFGAGNHVLKEETAPSIEVRTTTLDDYCQGGPYPTFMKIDVEGHELDVLQGASKLLASPGLLGILAETFRPHNFDTPKLQAIERLLAEAGFMPYGYNPANDAMRPFTSPNEGDNNTLYLRDLDEIGRRLADSSGRTW